MRRRPRIYFRSGRRRSGRPRKASALPCAQRMTSLTHRRNSQRLCDEAARVRPAKRRHGVDRRGARGRDAAPVWRGRDEPARIYDRQATRQLRRIQPCVAANKCKDADWKCADTAVASREAATAYCQWRGARLPSLAQLQRAIRGAKGDKYPTGGGWLATEGRKDATAKDPRTHEPRRCQNVTADGVVYYVMDTEAFEWTRDVDGEKAEEPASTKPVGMNTFNETLDSAGVRHDPEAAMGTFRCAR